jgi:hypothetical protein
MISIVLQFCRCLMLSDVVFPSTHLPGRRASQLRGVDVVDCESDLPVEQMVEPYTASAACKLQFREEFGHAVWDNFFRSNN